jgi:hypothetical protein
MDDHFGIWPDESVMRVYAAALAQKTKPTKMAAYFFKV